MLSFRWPARALVSLLAVSTVGCCDSKDSKSQRIYEVSADGKCPTSTKLTVKYKQIPETVRWDSVYGQGRWFLGGPPGDKKPVLDIALSNAALKPSGKYTYTPGDGQYVIGLSFNNKAGSIKAGTYTHTDIGGGPMQFSIGIGEPGKNGFEHHVSMKSGQGGKLELTHITADKVCGSLHINTADITLTGDFVVSAAEGDRKPLTK